MTEIKIPYRFDFPPLGPTGEGPIPYPRPEGSDGHTPIWSSGPYGVSHQHDNPACAYRCHYPGGSSPCDLETMVRFVEWATQTRIARMAVDP